MRLLTKPAIIVVITIIVIIGGFVLLLRGCLSKYDERSAISSLLYFKKDSAEVLFSMVKFEKATSYSQKGGLIHKTVSTNYYIQCNDARTGKKIADRKIKHHSDIKQYPVETIGSSGQYAWVFIGELMAFDPFTLNLKADLAILKEKNPALKDRFPAEERYYQFNTQDQSIDITATDGSTWTLNTTTLLATEQHNDKAITSSEKIKNDIELLLKNNQQEHDSLYERQLRRPSRQLQSKAITMEQYQQISKIFYSERELLGKTRDSLRKLLLMADKLARVADENKRLIANLANRSGISFGEAKTNQDTSYHQWAGIYAPNEIDKLYNRIQMHTMYGETSRRVLYTTNFSQDRSGDYVFNKEKITAPSPNSFFLDGGFLMNKSTARPPHLPGTPGYLIIHKDKIGNDGIIQVSRIGMNGQPVWSFNPGLKQWGDWIVSSTHLFILGTNNKELSSSSYNILWSVDLSSGKALSYDFFNDK